MRHIRLALVGLLALAALALLALLLWSDGSEPPEARAYPGLTVGIDMNPATTTDTNNDGLYETVDLNTFESCRQFSAAAGQQFTVDVFVLDVLDLTAFYADLEYAGSVVKVIKSYTGTTPSNSPKMFLSTQTTSEVQNTSDNGPIPSTGVLSWPDTDGHYQASAFDSSHITDGDDGSGRLVSITLETVAAGVSPFNVDIDLATSRGVILRGLLSDGTVIFLGDGNADGWYDYPFINENSTISVGQPDQDGDGIQDPCDPDMDGDGICNVGGPLPPGTPGTPPGGCAAGPGGTDNCPTIANPTQSDIDGDGKGNECDEPEADGDGYHNATEISYGSNKYDPSSVPEVCDGLDNDGDTSVDEGAGNPPTPFRDADGDTVPDCVDGNVDTDGDTIVNTVDTDDDGDGTTDANENTIGTDSLFKCHNGSGLPDWPQDFDGSRNINITDVFKVTPPYFGSSLGSDTFERRRDLAPSGVINISDVFRMLPPTFGSSCTP